MHRSRILPKFVLLSVFAAVSSLGCTSSERPQPGYDGPLPTTESRRTIDELGGEILAIQGGEIGAGEWVIGKFAVIPNEITRKCGGVTLSRDDERAFLPLLSDADVADLWWRAGCEARKTVENEELSEPYRRALGI